MGGIQCQFNVFGSGTGHFGEGFACDGANVIEILAFHRRHPFATDEIFVLGFELNRTARTIGNRILHAATPSVMDGVENGAVSTTWAYISTLNPQRLFAVQYREEGNKLIAMARALKAYRPLINETE